MPWPHCSRSGRNDNKFTRRDVGGTALQPRLGYHSTCTWTILQPLNCILAPTYTPVISYPPPWGPDSRNRLCSRIWRIAATRRGFWCGQRTQVIFMHRKLIFQSYKLVNNNNDQIIVATVLTNRFLHRCELTVCDGAVCVYINDIYVKSASYISRIKYMLGSYRS